MPEISDKEPSAHKFMLSDFPGVVVVSVVQQSYFLARGQWLSTQAAH